MSEIRLRYKSEPDKSLTVRLVHTFRRNDLEMSGLPILSSSGGPKEMMRNDIWSLFHKDAGVDAVSMVRASGTPFYIMRKGAQYFDVTGAEVEVAQRRSSTAAAETESVRPVDERRHDD